MQASIITGIVAGALAAALVDINAFLNARSQDPLVKFDWYLMAFRLVGGAITGYLGALGVNTLVG